MQEIAIAIENNYHQLLREREDTSHIEYSLADHPLISLPSAMNNCYSQSCCSFINSNNLLTCLPTILSLLTHFFKVSHFCFSPFLSDSPQPFCCYPVPPLLLFFQSHPTRLQKCTNITLRQRRQINSSSIVFPPNFTSNMTGGTTWRSHLRRTTSYIGPNVTLLNV